MYPRRCHDYNCWEGQGSLGLQFKEAYRGERVGNSQVYHPFHTGQRIYILEQWAKKRSIRFLEVEFLPSLQMRRMWGTAHSIEEKVIHWSNMLLSEVLSVRSIRPVRSCSRNEQLALMIWYFQNITTKWWWLLWWNGDLEWGAAATWGRSRPWFMA